MNEKLKQRCLDKVSESLKYLDGRQIDDARIVIHFNNYDALPTINYDITEYIFESEEENEGKAE